MNKFAAKLDGFFQIKDSGSSIKTEILAGITTFMTMAYIMFLAPGWIAGDAGTPLYNAVYIGTAIAAIIGTLVMGLYAKLPFAQAPGVGLSAFFAFTVMKEFSFAAGLTIVFISGIVFILLTFVGIRERVVAAIPACIKAAIPSGIGLFIAFIGLQNSGIIINNDSNLVGLQIFNVFKADLAAVVPAITAFATILLIGLFVKLKLKGAVLFGILGGSIFYYIFGGICNACGVQVLGPISIYNPFNAFKDFGTEAFGVVFYKGFTELFTSGDFVTVVLPQIATFITVLLSFTMVDMFDTVGTLLGTAKKANMLDENGELPRIRKALFADAVGTAAGAVVGVPTVTTYVESAAGVSEGGRTGFTAVIVAVGFFLVMFLSPIAALIPSGATAGALIYVGVLMISSIADIDFSDVTVAIPAFLTLILMPLTYSIADGIGVGMISYVLLKMITGKVKEIHPVTYVIAALFILKFIFA